MGSARINILFFLLLWEMLSIPLIAEILLTSVLQYFFPFQMVGATVN